MLSPPAWWCGLKFQFLWCHLWPPAVTTCVVVWIEILCGYGIFRHGSRHHLRGGVD